MREKLKKKQEEGFSLAETVIALGLVGLLGLGFSQGTKLIANLKKGTDQDAAVSLYKAEGINTLKKITKGLSWEKMDFENSYIQILKDKKLNLVDWNFSDISQYSSYNDIRERVQGKGASVFHNFVRDSHTMVKATKTGDIAYFSRCIEKEEYWGGSLKETMKLKLTVNEAKNLDLVPFVVKDGKRNRVYCCSRRKTGDPDATLCSEEIVNRESDYRIMTFQFKKGNLKVFPTPQERKYLLGTGFIVFLNRGQVPDSFNAYNITIKDNCFIKESNNENCQSNGKIYVRFFQGQIAKNSVFGSGSLITD